MTSPWKTANAPASNFSLGNYVGQLLLVCVGGTHENWPIGNETAPAVRGNVVVVESGEEWLDVLMFAVKVVAQFRGETGNVVLGRVVAERGRGSNEMYSIDPKVSPTDEQWAHYWHSQHPNRLAELQHLAAVTFQAEEARRTGGHSPAPQSQAAPPPPPPPPAAPPQPPAAPPAYAPPAAPPPSAGVAPGGPPPWSPGGTETVNTPPAPNQHIVGGPPMPGDTSTPPY